MGRLDNRTLDQFKQDIKYGTMLEKYWAVKLLDTLNCRAYPDMPYSLEDNGIDNAGDYVEVSSGDADYKLCHPSGNKLLEVKWCPTAGKISLKKHDVKAYIRQQAHTFIILNTNKKTSLKKPKDANWENQQKIIEHFVKHDHIRWTILPPETLEQIVEEQDCVKIPWMGGKQGYILKQPEIDKYGDWDSFATKEEIGHAELLRGNK